MSKALSNLVSKEIIATPEQVKAATPDEIVQYVNDAHALVLAAHQSAVERAMEMGRLLIAVKGNQNHGSFTHWIDRNTKFSIRTAQRYMKLANEVPKLGKAEATRVSLLSLREGLAAIQKTTDDALKVRKPDRVKVLNRAIKNDQSINRESDAGQWRHAAKLQREFQPSRTAADMLPPEGTPGVSYKTTATPDPDPEVVEQVDGDWEVVDEDDPDAPAPPVERPKRMPPFKRATSKVVYASINTVDLDSTVDGFMHEVDHGVLKDLATKILERLTEGGAA